MLPDVFGFEGVEDVFSAEHATDSAGCAFELVRALGGEFLS